MHTTSTPAALALALAAASALVLSACAATPTPDTGSDEDVNPSRSEALSMPSCGTVLASYDGTEVFSNAGDTATGNSCAGSGQFGLQYQCVELVMRHFKTHWNLRWYGNANQLLDNAPKADVAVYENGDGAHPPVPGDMIVWKKGAWGHVALVVSVGSGSIDIVEQNVKGPGTATLAWDGATIGVRWGNWVAAGWAHAKQNGGSPSGADGGGAQGGSNAGGAGQSGSNAAGSGQTGSGDPGGKPSDPGVDWSCSKSSYQGNQLWTCSGGNLYRCEGGAPVETTCDAGCVTNPVGTDDVCASSKSGGGGAVDWNCSKSSYGGNQYWTCSGGSRFKCVGGSPVEEACDNGCVSQPLGTDDVCK